MALQEYHRKRRFGTTPEPRGAAAGARKGKALGFVVQLHHARGRHYDFRLEVDGVLRSWAVPRGPSLRAGEKRLAVEVEDHPLSYGRFEGAIPEGNYGAGHVAIFDHGTWEPDGDPAEAIRRGKLEFELHGEHLKGRWKLLRTAKPASKPQWLLLKRDDAHAADLEADDLIDGIPAPPVDAPGASTAKGLRILATKSAGGTNAARGAGTAGGPVAKPSRTRAAASKATSKTTGRATRRTAAPAGAGKRRTTAGGPDPDALRDRARALAGPRPQASGFVPPMLTTAAKSPPAGERWLHEWKWDGYRIIAEAGARPRLWSRNGAGWDERVPELVRALAGLPIPALLDGELIAVDARGYSDFNALQHALKEGETAQLRYAVFDLLALDGLDLADAPLTERKRLLEQLLLGADPRLFYSGHVVGHGAEMFAAASGQGMEGIISKRVDSTYQGGRSSHWLKIKPVETRDFVVVGYTQPKGSRQGVGALLLAHEQSGQLVYAGRVGSGLGDAVLRELPALLKPGESATPTVALPLHTRLPAAAVQWVRPRMMVEVVFRGWGKEGLLRQASFHRLRADKPVDDRDGNGKADANPTQKRIGAARKSERAAAVPAPSSPGRVVYPDAGYTKQDVFDYYLAVADRLLGEIGGRLLSVVRCPDGIAGQHFFQKHAGAGFGDAIHRHAIRENDGDEARYFSIDDVAGLMNLVQMNALEFHPWGSRVDTLELPDRMVFDLDPDPSVGWSEIKAAARDVRARLQQAGLDSYPRLSGGKGVHVVVPIRPEADWARVRHFCEAFAGAMAQHSPERYVATMSKAKRKGRIFIDWLRNGRGATAIASWSLRARPGAPVAMPLAWDELARVRRPDRYTLRDAAQRGTPDFIAALVAGAPTLPT